MKKPAPETRQGASFLLYLTPSLMAAPCLVRDYGTIRSFSWPSADQSRWASSRSLSDFEIQSARRRP